MPTGVYLRTKYHKELLRMNGLKMRGENHPNWKGGRQEKCIDCGKHISRQGGIDKNGIPRKVKRCRSCSSIFFRGEKATNWKGKIEKTCKECGKKFSVYVYREDTALYCSKNCLHNSRIGCAGWSRGKTGIFSKETILKMSKAKKGLYSKEKHPNWLGGKSFEEYGFDFDSNLKEKVRFREGYKCKLCGCSQLENGKQLDVHHIDYNKKNNIVSNLIALCHVCHMKTNFNRSMWQEKFTKIIDEVNLCGKQYSK